MKAHSSKRSLGHVIKKFKRYINTLLIWQKLKKQGLKEPETILHPEGSNMIGVNNIARMLEKKQPKKNKIMKKMIPKDPVDAFAEKFKESSTEFIQALTYDGGEGDTYVKLDMIHVKMKAAQINILLDEIIQLNMDSE